MFSKSYADGLVIREITQEELNSHLDLHFKTAFANRQDNGFASTIPDEAKEKIRDRNQKDQRYRLRLGAFLNNEFVGWHFGWATDSEVYYMTNSAVLENFRGKGIYQRILECIMEVCKSEGFQVLSSIHHANNPAILIPKLKTGFIISGVQFHERFRFVVELRYFYDSKRRQHFGHNMGLDL